MPSTIPLTVDEFLRPTSMTCLECDASMVVYPSLEDERFGTAVCPLCSPPRLGDVLLVQLQEERAGLALPALTVEEASPVPATPSGGVRRWLESLKQHTEGEGE